MIRRPPRSTQSRSSAASDVYKRQHHVEQLGLLEIARVSGLRHEYQAGGRHVALEHERRVEAGLVFVAADDEGRHPALCHLLLEVAERRAQLSLIHISEPTRLGMISYAV